MHLAVMDSVVDQFVIVEGRYTFSGYEKELCFNPYTFSPWMDKIKYLIVEDKPLPSAWHNEWRQRNHIQKGIDPTDPNTIIIIRT